ncbi:MAG: ATP-binding protein [Isosphaera sp.]|nr:ATP-binding protein [Isosphaera sp.]
MTAVLLVACAAAPAAGPPPHAKVGPVGPADCRWTAGFWAERFETCRSATIPFMGDLMEGTARSQFLHNFRVAAGLEAGRHRGPPWNDGDYYKWLEAVAGVHAVAPDPALDKRMDAAIAIIAKAQRADGYLHTPVQIANRNGAAEKPFADRLNFEMYNFGHLFTAAAVHHRATGKKTLLAVAVKAADFLAAAFENPTPELARNAVCPSHYMGAVDLYRATGDKKYLRLAAKFIDLRDQATAGGTDDNQDRVPFRRQTEAVGHAVRANYLYAGAADVYAETGDETLLAPLKPIWASVVTRKMYLTGACGALYDGASPDGSKDQKQISRVHQAYGRDYQLPHSTAHNETCAAIGNALWNERMLRVTGEAKYADVLETTLLNALLAGVSLDGKRFFYTNTLRQLDTMPAALRWSRDREEWISCYCCPPNVARVVAQVNASAYGRSDRGVWVHLYGGNTLDTTLPDGRRVKLKQETDYPWDGRVKLTVESAPAGEWSLFLRVPGWADGATLAVNGKPADAKSGTYAEVRREWKAGDVVALSLPLRPRLVQAHPLVEEARNQVAVVRGPLVYCLESTDLPKGARVQDVALPREVGFTPRHDPKLLGGVTVLEAKAELVGDRPWGDELYREFKPAAAKPVDVRLVPHYAWANRGRSEMTVWMPLGR